MNNDLKPLTHAEIEQKLKDFPGWSYKDNKIFKEFRFQKYNDVIKFVDELALFSNKIDHHPDIHIYYKKVVFELCRFDIGFKVTSRDFTVANKIEEMFSKYQSTINVPETCSI